MHSDHFHPGCMFALVSVTAPNLILAACVLSGVSVPSGFDHDFFSSVDIINSLLTFVCLISITWRATISNLLFYEKEVGGELNLR